MRNGKMARRNKMLTQHLAYAIMRFHLYPIGDK